MVQVSPLRLLALLRRGQLKGQTSVPVTLILPLTLYFMLLWRSTSKTTIEMGENYWRQMRQTKSAWNVVLAAHVVLWRYLFTKAVLATRAGLFAFRTTVSVPMHAVTLVGQTTENISMAFQDSLQHRFDLWLDSQINLLGEKLKHLLKDPYMPSALQNTIDDAVDLILPDLKLALFLKTDEYITFTTPTTQRFNTTQEKADEESRELQKRASGDSDRATVEDEEWVDLDNLLEVLEPENRNRKRLRVITLADVQTLYHTTRGFILYTLSPYNKSFFHCLHNPFYYGLQCIGLIPTYGVVWWLWLFLLCDRKDEYQVCQFILGFQTAKFFGQGVLGLVKGAFLYYLCATRDVSTCSSSGPKVNHTTDAVSFFFQIVLVWLTFFILPYTKACVNVADERDAYLINFEQRQDINRAALQAKVRLGRGGRLSNLFWWETFTVVFVLLLAITSYFLYSEINWKFYSTLYWIKTLYGLLSLPFVVFKLPVMGGLLTTTKATGYDRRGQTVLKVVKYEDAYLAGAQQQIQFTSQNLDRTTQYNRMKQFSSSGFQDIFPPENKGYGYEERIDENEIEVVEKRDKEFFINHFDDDDKEYKG